MNQPSVEHRLAGTLYDGREVGAWTLSNGHGMACQILEYGATLTQLWVPDRNGVAVDVLLGFDRLEDWEKRNESYFGVVAGRVAGRIPNGILRIEGREFHLSKNDRGNHLHGGLAGLDKRLWPGETVTDGKGAVGVRLGYISPDGEEGYPGEVRMTVTYWLTAAGELVFETEAESDQVTPITLAQHGYFNLAGEASGAATDHVVWIFSDEVMKTDGNMTPLGIAESVDGMAADLRSGRRIGEALPLIWQEHGDLYRLGRDGEMKVAAKITEPASGREMIVSTTHGFLQFYGGGHLDGTTRGKGGVAYPRHAGLCFECQGYSDPGAGFGDTLLRPGEVQRHRTIYGFATGGVVSI
jgi:aldose 1-epimerase